VKKNVLLSSASHTLQAVQKQSLILLHHLILIKLHSTNYRL